MPLKTGIIAVGVTMLLAVVGCAGQPEIREVTREVPVTQQVPITVETVQTVEVTRVVPATQQVPVTVVVFQDIPVTVEVTRAVEIVKTIEVPVTRIVAPTPVPSPAKAPTTVPDTPTPIPTATMPPAPTATPIPAQSSPFDGWSMQTERYGDREFVMFHKPAVAYGTLPKAPLLTYQCDTRGNRALYINWPSPIVTGGPELGRYSPDPFKEYRNDRLTALLEYADDLIEFTGDLTLDRRQQTDLDDLWEQVRKRWLYGYDATITPDNLLKHARSLTYGQAIINLDLYLETTDPDKRSPYGPPVLETISGNWFVSHHHARMHAGTLGELRPAYRRAFPSEFPVIDTQPVVIVTVMEPTQPTEVVAKWRIGDLLKVMAHCEITTR